MNSDASNLPGPVKIVLVNVEDTLPELHADSKYSDALVIGYRDDVPLAALDIDLRPSAPPVRDQLGALFTGARETVDTYPQTKVLPTISVVVPTIVARREDLLLLLDGFGEVKYPEVEFILVDNRRLVPEDDPLPGLIAGRRNIKVIREERPGISAARNAGIAAAVGDIVAFTDDDVRVEPNWLLALGRRFVSDPELDAVTGLILPAEMETPAQIWFERYYGGFSGERTFAPLKLRSAPSLRALRGSRVVVTDTDGKEVRRFSVYGAGAYGAGANMAFRRSTLLKHGSFDLALGTGTPARGGEDLAMLISILWSGGSVGYEPAAVAHHRHRRELEELHHQLRGNGLGFTAMLTSLVLHDTRHLLGLGSQLPIAGWQMVKQSLKRLRGRKVTTDAVRPDAHAAEYYPRNLVIQELRGYPLGPSAYWQSRRRITAWTKKT